MSILVTGGAGFIGSHTVVELQGSGQEVVIVDNFINSKPEVLTRIQKITGKKPKFYECDMLDKKALDKVFKKEKIDAVIHFAGLKAVGESVEKPVLYYQNNLLSSLNLLDCMKKYGVKNLVFSSSATVYGDPVSVPIQESAKTGDVTNPYGATKVFIERILTDAQKADSSLNIALLRYFNPIGAHESGLLGEDPAGIPNNLAPYILRVATGKLPQVNVFGSDYKTKDGTGVRDYLHVVDLARGHLCALKKLFTNPGLVVYNLGTGRGYSVLEIIEAFSRAVGKPIPYVITERRAGDIAECYASTDKASSELGFTAEFTLDDMCRDGYRFAKGN